MVEFERSEEVRLSVSGSCSGSSLLSSEVVWIGIATVRSRLMRKGIRRSATVASLRRYSFDSVFVNAFADWGLMAEARSPPTICWTASRSKGFRSSRSFPAEQSKSPTKVIFRPSSEAVLVDDRDFSETVVRSGVMGILRGFIACRFVDVNRVRGRSFRS